MSAVVIGGWSLSSRGESAEPATRGGGGAASLPEKISFNEHIQPLLSEYCYHCHGPDSGTREPKEAPLRLDREADALAPRADGKPVIVKGKPAESLLVRLFHADDPV